MSALPSVIVGCGPAGLAAASVLQRQAPGRPFLVLEAGGALSARQRTEPTHIISGVGGAGLYSDGKFSFFPAATALWRLTDSPRLARAYGWLQRQLLGLGVSTPELLAPSTAQAAAGFKPYPSLYIDEARRYQLIAQLFAPLQREVWLESRLLDLERNPGGGWRLWLSRSGATRELLAGSVLFAGGRFAPLQMSHYKAAPPMRFSRIELGLRLEGEARHPFFSELRASGASLDPKLIINDEARALEWRTFCCCVEGEVVQAYCDGLWSLSGRADCAPTGRSNVGVNVRFLQKPPGFSLAQLTGQRPFSLSLPEVLEGAQLLDEVYGASVASLLREGLSRLVGRFPSLRRGALRASGPVIEGVGEYPESDAGLSMKGEGLYVAGDACGRFRGLVAALLSGAYAGEVLASL